MLRCQQNVVKCLGCSGILIAEMSRIAYRCFQMFANVSRCSHMLSTRSRLPGKRAGNHASYCINGTLQATLQHSCTRFKAHPKRVPLQHTGFPPPISEVRLSVSGQVDNTNKLLTCLPAAFILVHLEFNCPLLDLSPAALCCAIQRRLDGKCC